ncbi:MAG TPA: hypothetical protein PLZ51_25990, partial [Aggregatilineales bacterium]|nr:hypothetical protein [Aggregatilineales bacterium]
MKRIYHILLVCIALIWVNSASIADDDAHFPPIMPENRSQTEMIQMLSQGGVHQLTWSPNGEQLAVTA